MKEDEQKELVDSKAHDDEQSVFRQSEKAAPVEDVHKAKSLSRCADCRIPYPNVYSVQLVKL